MTQSTWYSGIRNCCKDFKLICFPWIWTWTLEIKAFLIALEAWSYNRIQSYIMSILSMVIYNRLYSFSLWNYNFSQLEFSQRLFKICVLLNGKLVTWLILTHFSSYCSWVIHTVLSYLWGVILPESSSCHIYKVIPYHPISAHIISSYMSEIYYSRNQSHPFLLFYWISIYEILGKINYRNKNKC